MTGEQLRQRLAAPPRRRNKYGAKKAIFRDRALGLSVVLDSQAERDYAEALQTGCLDWWYGPNVVLQDEPLVTYRPDFLVWGTDGLQAVDVKGMATPAFRLKAKLWKARYPTIPLVLVHQGEEVPA